MKNIWETSVSELIEIFRGALQAVIPFVEKACIRWKESDNYDDWDNIATALYENIVCSSLIGDVMEQYPIAKYDMIYNDYTDLDFIGVRSSQYPKDQLLAFVSFASLTSPLDRLRVCLLDDTYQAKDQVLLDVKNVDFYFAKQGQDRRQKYETIIVKL